MLLDSIGIYALLKKSIVSTVQGNQVIVDPTGDVDFTIEMLVVLGIVELIDVSTQNCLLSLRYRFTTYAIFIILWSMKKTIGIRHGRHCVFNLHVHLVFVTKYRKAVFSKAVLIELENIFSSVCKDFEAELAEFDGERDHVHLLVNYPPKVAVSKLVNSLKGVSSRLIRKMQFPEIEKILWGDHFWSPSYFACSCGGAPIEIIRQYIEQQQTPED